MDVRIGDWSLAKEAGGAYVVDFPTHGFTLALRLEPTQPPMLNGDLGYSQKTPDSTVAGMGSIRGPNRIARRGR